MKKIFWRNINKLRKHFIIIFRRTSSSRRSLAQKAAGDLFNSWLIFFLFYILIILNILKKIIMHAVMKFCTAGFIVLRRVAILQWGTRYNRQIILKKYQNYQHYPAVRHQVQGVYFYWYPPKKLKYGKPT